MATVAKAKDTPTSLLSEKAHKLVESVNIYSETLNFLDGAFNSKLSHDVEKKAASNGGSIEPSRKPSTVENPETKRNKDKILNEQDNLNVTDVKVTFAEGIPTQETVQVRYSQSNHPPPLPESITTNITSDLQSISKELDEKLQDPKSRNSVKVDDPRSSSNSISARKSVIKETPSKPNDISEKSQKGSPRESTTSVRKSVPVEPEIVRKESIGIEPNSKKESAAIYNSKPDERSDIRSVPHKVTESQLESNGVILSKVSSIESELLSLKEAKRKETEDTVKIQNHELLLKNSRQSLEMKSFMDQNNTLRKENKRLLELEANLRARIVELEMPNQQLAVIDPQDQVIQERLLQKLDEHLAWISACTTELQTISEDLLQTTKLQEKLQMYTESCAVLKKSIRSAVNAPNVKHFLVISSGLVEAIVMDSKEIWRNYKEARDVDKRIIKLSKESHRVRIEATETIQNLTSTNEKQVQELTKSLKKTETKLKAASEKYKLLNTEYEKLGKEHQELIKENKELKVLADRPPVQPEVVVLSNSDESEMKKEFEKILEANTQYKQLIENLKATIQEWKNENDLLQVSLKEMKQKYEKAEAENLKYTRKIGNLETLIEDEKLKNQKAAELLKSLQQQPVQTVKPESTPIDAILEQHLKALDTIIQKPTPPPSKNLELLQHKVSQHLKELADKDLVITKLNQQLDDTETELLETSSILQIYQEQYNVVNGLVVTNATCHPYPFSQLFVALHEKYISIQTELKEAHEQLAKLVQKSEHEKKLLLKEKETCKELETQIKSKIQLVCEIEQQLEKVRGDNLRLVGELNTANLEKQKFKDIVKKLTKGAVEYFSN
ncbi:hypothetical protein HK103_001498 [Boothiomyces macroporosus]|uniref:Uncharacterized protein n=1 Tax=Boothiomyces macroporosus TaxID=261099 RepID=A0AAD5UMG2_9FUNG|nr:hypothetical protein HK103_001498 [Boothiomyces macroporosus]